MDEKDIRATLKKKGYSDEQIDSAMNFLDKREENKEKRQEYAKKKMADPAFKAKMQKAAKRRGMKAKLLTKKALEAGITVSDAEIDAALAK